MVYYSYQPATPLAQLVEITAKSPSGPKHHLKVGSLLLVVPLLAEGFLPFAFQKLLTLQLEKKQLGLC